MVVKESISVFHELASFHFLVRDALRTMACAWHHMLAWASAQLLRMRTLGLVLSTHTRSSAVDAHSIVLPFDRCSGSTHVAS